MVKIIEEKASLDIFYRLKTTRRTKNVLLFFLMLIMFLYNIGYNRV